jgi:hypothetical protein
VAKLLQYATHGNTAAATRRALELRTEGTALREIGIRLAGEGMRPKAGGLWHPAQVAKLLASAQSESYA